MINFPRDFFASKSWESFFYQSQLEKDHVVEVGPGKTIICQGIWKKHGILIYHTLIENRRIFLGIFNCEKVLKSAIILPTLFVKLKSFVLAPSIQVNWILWNFSHIFPFMRLLHFVLVSKFTRMFFFCEVLKNEKFRNRIAEWKVCVPKVTPGKNPWFGQNYWKTLVDYPYRFGCVHKTQKVSIDFTETHDNGAIFGHSSSTLLLFHRR